MILVGAVAAQTEATAHEYWIEPEAGFVESGGTVNIHLRNGQMFAGGSFPFIPARFARFSVIDAAGERPAEAQIGDTPTLTEYAPADGATILVYVSQPDSLQFNDFETFKTYVAYEGQPELVDAHLARGLPEKGFRERYTRHCKAMIVAGDVEDARDRKTGMLFEWVALDPLPVKDTVRFQLLWQGQPLADFPGNVFTKSSSAERDGKRIEIRTDGDGIVTLNAADLDRYVMVNAVRILPVDDDAEFVWESHWASHVTVITAP